MPQAANGRSQQEGRIGSVRGASYCGRGHSYALGVALAALLFFVFVADMQESENRLVARAVAYSSGSTPRPAVIFRRYCRTAAETPQRTFLMYAFARKDFRNWQTRFGSGRKVFNHRTNRTNNFTLSLSETSTRHVITPSFTWTDTPTITITVTLTSVTPIPTPTKTCVLTDTMTETWSRSPSMSPPITSSFSLRPTPSQTSSISLRPTPSASGSFSETGLSPTELFTTSQLPATTSLPPSRTVTRRAACPVCFHGYCNPITLRCVCHFDTAKGFWYGGSEGGSCMLCAPGYYGATCRSECPGGGCNACTKHGVCDDGTTGTGVCTCMKGVTTGFWAGDRCDRCAAGYYGLDCKKKCQCSGHGQCDEGLFGTGGCLCTPGYLRADCSACNATLVAGCVECPGSCSGHGRCVALSTDSLQGTCLCDDWFGLPDCSAECPGHCGQSSPTALDGGGVCLMGANRTGACQCVVGREPPYCDVCARGRWGALCNLTCSCSGRGSCTQLEGLCQCDDGFVGDSCSRACPTGGTTLAPCSGHGFCVSPSGTCKCQSDARTGMWSGPACGECAAGYGGPVCTTRCPSSRASASAPEPLPCGGSSRGACLPSTGACECIAPACGIACDGTVDPPSMLCSPCPLSDSSAGAAPLSYGPSCDQACACTSHGTCNAGRVGDGTCTCVANYGGSRCEVPCPRASSGAVCSDRGLCQAATGECGCAAGFAGEACQLRCPNCGAHGRCDEGNHGTALCICDAGWLFPATGCVQFCDCNGHGTCVPSDPTKPLGASPLRCVCDAPSWDGAQCDRCAAGYHGDDCSRRCVRGTTAARVCTCDPGVGGVDCDVSCPASGNLTCARNGVCDEGLGRTGLCKCFEGYVGPGCQCLTSFCAKSGRHACDPATGACGCAANRGGPPACLDCSRTNWGTQCEFNCRCSSHGVCIRLSGSCDCDRNAAAGYWAGDDCSACAVGYMGANCTYPTVTINAVAPFLSRYASPPLYNDTRSAYLAVESGSGILLAGGSAVHAAFPMMSGDSVVSFGADNTGAEDRQFCAAQPMRMWAFAMATSAAGGVSAANDGTSTQVQAAGAASSDPVATAAPVFLFAVRGFCDDLYQLFGVRSGQTSIGAVGATPPRMRPFNPAELPTLFVTQVSSVVDSLSFEADVSASNIWTRSSQTQDGTTLTLAGRVFVFCYVARNPVSGILFIECLAHAVVPPEMLPPSVTITGDFLALPAVSVSLTALSVATAMTRVTVSTTATSAAARDRPSFVIGIYGSVGTSGCAVQSVTLRIASMLQLQLSVNVGRGVSGQPTLLLPPACATIPMVVEAVPGILVVAYRRSGTEGRLALAAMDVMASRDIAMESTGSSAFSADGFGDGREQPGEEGRPSTSFAFLGQVSPPYSVSGLVFDPTTLSGVLSCFSDSAALATSDTIIVKYRLVLASAEPPSAAAAATDTGIVSSRLLAIVPYGQVSINETLITALAIHPPSKLVFALIRRSIGVVVLRFLLTDLVSVAPVDVDWRGGTVVSLTGVAFPTDASVLAQAATLGGEALASAVAQVTLTDFFRTAKAALAAASAPVPLVTVYCRFGDLIVEGVASGVSNTALCQAPKVVTLRSCHQESIALSFMSRWGMTKNIVQVNRVEPPTLKTVTPSVVAVAIGEEVLGLQRFSVTGDGFLPSAAIVCRFTDVVTTLLSPGTFQSTYLMSCARPPVLVPLLPNASLTIALDGQLFSPNSLSVSFFGAPIDLRATPPSLSIASAAVANSSDSIRMDAVDTLGNVVTRANGGFATILSVRSVAYAVDSDGPETIQTQGAAAAASAKVPPRVFTTFPFTRGSRDFTLPSMAFPATGRIIFTAAAGALVANFSVLITQGVLARMNISEEPLPVLFVNDALQNSPKVQLLDVSDNLYVPATSAVISCVVVGRATGRVVQSIPSQPITGLAEVTFTRPSINAEKEVEFYLKFSYEDGSVAQGVSTGAVDITEDAKRNGNSVNVVPVVSRIVSLQCLTTQYRFIDPVTALSACRTCEVGTTCNGSTVLLLLPGYWASNASHPIVYPCPKGPDACLGGTVGAPRCADMYAGLLCDDCAPGFGRSNSGSCQHCLPAPLTRFILSITTLVTFTFIVTAAVAVVQYITGEEGQQVLLLIVLLFDFGQVVSSMRLIQVPWPAALWETYSWMATLTDAALHSVASDCEIRSLGATPQDAHVIYYATVVLFIPMGLIVKAVLWKFPAVLTSRVRAARIRTMVARSAPPLEHSFTVVMTNTFIVQTFYVYQYIIQAAVQTLQCQSVVDGPVTRSVLQTDVRISCTSADYETSRGIALAVLVVYGFLLPAALGLGTMVSLSMLDSPKAMAYLGIAMLGIKRERWYWFAIIILRKAAFVGVLAFGAGAVSSYMALWILSFFAFLTWSLRPYTNDALNYLSMFATFASVNAVNGSLILQSVTDTAAIYFVAVWVLGCYLGLLVLLAMAFSSDMRSAIVRQLSEVVFDTGTRVAKMALGGGRHFFDEDNDAEDDVKSVAVLRAEVAAAKAAEADAEREAAAASPSPGDRLLSMPVSPERTPQIMRTPAFTDDSTAQLDSAAKSLAGLDPRSRTGTAGEPRWIASSSTSASDGDDDARPAPGPRRQLPAALAAKTQSSKSAILSDAFSDFADW